MFDDGTSAVSLFKASFAYGAVCCITHSIKGPARTKQLHAAVVVPLAAILLAQKEPDVFSVLTTNGALTNFLNCASLGYFSYDSALAVKDLASGNTTFVFVVHGLLYMISTIVALYTGQARYDGACAMIYSASTFFYHSARFAKNAGAAKLHLFHKTAFVISFFVTRVCIGTYITKRAILGAIAGGATGWVVPMAISLALNYWWGAKIMLMLCRKKKPS